MTQRASRLFLLAAFLWLGCFSALATRFESLETRVGGYGLPARDGLCPTASQALATATGCGVSGWETAPGQGEGHNADPSLYGFCGGDPINYFDPDGRLATQVGREIQTDISALPQFALNVGNNVEQGNNDFWTGAFNSAGGLANAAAHPINTTASAINGVATLAANLTVDASGTVNNLYNGFANNFSDPNRASQFVGSLTFGTETAIGGGAAFQALTDVAETGTTLDQLSGAANRAAQNVGSGSGPVYGTQVHTAFQAEVEALGNPTLFTEQSYLNGIPVEYGTPGSIRIDVGEGTVNAPTAVYDLKTGSATLTPARIQQIQSHLPGGSSVPVITIRP